ncbi:MAG: hypothetical protein FGM15_11695 [Chthoniobacterales bacterium]|nr:hypothetical protein [Chthoniobacterales bacterium]
MANPGSRSELSGLSGVCAGFSPAARWIWLLGDPLPVNAVADFQGRFSLKNKPRRVHLRISADSRYRLHVNGRLVGHGPARGYPGHYYYDEHDITRLLNVGVNVVDVRVVHWGEGTFHGLVLRAGMICEVSAGDGLPLSSSTRAWRGRTAAAYAVAAPRIACQMGFEEQVDLALEAGAGDGRPATGKGWGSVVEIGGAASEPWGPLKPRAIPDLGGETSVPVGARDCGQTTDEGLVLSLRAGNDLGCEMRAANSKRTDGFFAAAFHAPQAGILRLRRCAMYGNPVRVFLDGREVKLQQARFDLEARVPVRRGSHVLVLDWHGVTHDTDVGVSLSDIPGLARAPLPGFGDATWVFRKPAGQRALIRRARTWKELAALRGWRAVSPAQTPAHDVYVAMTAREPGPTVPLAGLPLSISPGVTPRRVVLDFGAERLGRIALEIDAPRGSVIEIMGVEAWGPQGPQFTELMSNTARVLCKGGRQRFESIVTRGLRHLILDIRPEGRELRLLDAQIRSETFPWNPRGRFACSETRLNQIYEMCAHTLRMSSMDVFVDAVYEQTLWVGDTCSMLIPVHHYVQGESSLPEHSLRMIARSLERTPLVNSQVPGSWEDRIIPNWSFFWVSGVRAHYEMGGNVAFLREMLPALARQADFVLRSTNDEGLFEMHGNVWHFLDWNGQADDCHSVRHAVYCHENCLALAAFQDTAWLAREAGDFKLAARMKSAAGKLRAAIMRRFKLRRQDAFGETRANGITSALVTASTQICALRAGLPENPAEVSRRVLSPPEDWVPTGTPWMWSLGALQACAHGATPQVCRGIAEHWGRMLDQGATAAWEMFEGRHRPGLPTRSWCHGWSAGPAWILPAYALGVRPAAPGWEKVIIAPQPGNLLWAEGVVPMPRGDLHVRWDLKDGRPHVRFKAPRGTTVDVR